jgi:hypothetical protein
MTTTGKMTRGDLVNHFQASLEMCGESVWSTTINANGKRYSLPSTLTSWLVSSYKRGVIDSLEPDSWITERLDSGSLRLYTRTGEHYSSKRERFFSPPVKVEIKSCSEYVEIRNMPKSQWWQAPFCCPFCETICKYGNECSHLLVMEHWLVDRYLSRNLESLFKQLLNTEFNINLANLHIPGLKIKLPIDFGADPQWYSFAYWYVEFPTIVPIVETMLNIGKNG